MVDRSNQRTFINQSGSELRVPPSGSELMLKSPVIADVMVQHAQVADENVVVAYLVVSTSGFPLLESANLITKRAGFSLTDTDYFLNEVTGNPKLVDTVTTYLRQVEELLEEIDSRQSMLLNERGELVAFPPLQLSEVGGFLVAHEVTDYQKNLLTFAVKTISFAHLFLRFY